MNLYCIHPAITDVYMELPILKHKLILHSSGNHPAITDVYMEFPVT